MGVSEDNKHHPKDLSRIYACGDVNYDIHMWKSAPHMDNWLGFCGRWADEAFFGTDLENGRLYALKNQPKPIIVENQLDDTNWFSPE